MTTTTTETIAEGSLKIRVAGMDCSACAIKIENALKRLPGVTDINLNYTTEILSLRLNSRRTAREVIESKIRALGYATFPLVSAGGTEEQIAPERDGVDLAWWQTRKGRMVLALGAVLAAAFMVSVLIPELSHWAYGAAALLGLVPFARRAFVGALAGTPFSIETLMTVAAAGALAIGAAEEATVVIFLFAVGELLETVAASRARAVIKALINLMPRVARLEQAGEIREVAVE